MVSAMIGSFDRCQLPPIGLVLRNPRAIGSIPTPGRIQKLEKDIKTVESRELVVIELHRLDSWKTPDPVPRFLVMQASSGKIAKG